MQDIKKIKKSSSKYTAGKITGFTDQNVDGKIKLIKLRPPKGDWHKLDHVYIKITALIQILTLSNQKNCLKNKKSQYFHEFGGSCIEQKSGCYRNKGIKIF